MGRYASSLAALGALAVALCSHARFAEAQPVEPDDSTGPGATPEAPAGTEWVHFSAGSVEGESDLRRLVLSEAVVVTAGRYRVTSDRIELEQTPMGLAVEGPGRVAFCPCPHPPMSLGFRRVLAAPPTDLLVTSPTLRVGNVPVLWLPYLWIRSPDRAGLLPPEVSWRSEEGFLVGTGVHLPYGKQRVDGQRRYVDLRGAGYVDGGVVLDVGLLGHRASTRVRWDHRRESLFLVEAHGAHPGPDRATIAYDVDAIRGERGRRGTLELEPAARRYDRALVSMLRADARSTLGAGLRADVLRASPLDEPGAITPGGHVGLGAAFARFGTAGLTLDATTSSDDEHGAVSVVRQRGESSIGAHAGPFGLDLVAGERTSLVVTEIQERASATLGGRARARLPLVRRFGGGPDPVVHRVEPYATVAGETSTSAGSYLLHLEPELQGELLGAELGTRSLVGRRHGLGAAELTGAVGWGGSPSALEAYAGLRGLVSYRAGALGGQAYVMPEHPGRATAALHARVGSARGPWLGGYAEGRRGVEPSVARFLEGQGSDWTRVGWFGEEGFTVGARAGVPWASWLASAVSLDVDAESQRLLAVHGSTAYRHPCGCMALVAAAGHRLGRDGIDAWLTLDLAP